MSTSGFVHTPLFIVLAGLVASHSSLAASKVQVDDTALPIEEVISWGTEIKSSSLSLSEDIMAIKQADHLSDLLRTIAGVDVGGAHSLNQRITIRSMDDKDLSISIDGANQNTYMYHHMGNLQIHADILKSVDIEIGTNSVVNGGLGGAVRFETKSADQLLKEGQRFGARVQAGYGDNGGDSWSLTGYGKLADSVDFLLYHNDVNRDNYDVGGDKIKGADGTEIAGTDGEVKGLEGEVQDTLIKLGWNITENQRFEIGYEDYIDEGDYSYRPDMGLATDIAIGDSLDSPLVWPTQFTRDTLTLNYDVEFSNTMLKVALFNNESTLKRDESAWQYSTAVVRGSPVSNWAAQVSGEAENQGINVIAETEEGMHTLTYGVEYLKYSTHYKASYLSGSVDDSKESAKASSVFLQDSIALTDQLTLIPGIRYDKYDMDAVLVDRSFDEITWAAAVQYQLTDNLVVKAGTTQLFKAPELAEVFVGAGLFDTPNANIKAETGYNTEFSLAYEDAIFGADRFSFGFTYFQTDIDDYIYDYINRSEKDNIGDMNIDGVEAYVGYEVGPLKTLLSFSSAESDLDADADYANFDGARLDRQQGDTVSLNVDYRLESLDLTLHWDLLNVGGVNSGLDLDGASLDNEKDGYTVHNLSARWTPSGANGFALTLGIDNVTDEFYASQSSRTGSSFHPLFGTLYLVDYEPGRNYKLTVSYDF